jgi:hypothetical protein
MNIIFLFVLVFNILRITTSFSSPRSCILLPIQETALHAYHFGQAAKKQSSTNNTGSSTTQKPTYYIPDGLTAEQYAKVKAADAAKFQNVDFGAWGPRWNKIGGDPQGNWFSMPGLWTGGYSREAVGAVAPRWMGDLIISKDGEVARWRRVLFGCLMTMRRYGVAYMMLVLSASYVTLQKQSTAKLIGARLVLPLLVIKPLDVVASRITPRIGWLRKNGMTKLAAVLSMIAALVFVWSGR